MYCSIENIKNIVPASILSDLTQDDDEIINNAIESAQATVNAYLQGSYKIESLQNLGMIQDITEKIAIYKIYSGFSADETPQIISTNYKISISQLEKLQSGKLSLGSELGASTTRDTEILCSKIESDKLFSKENLAGY